MLLKIYPKNPSAKNIRRVSEVIRNGGLIIIPTDSVYGIACDIFNSKAIQKVASLKGIKVEKADFSFIFSELSEISTYVRPINNNIFKVIRKNLPGPFTFILNANNKIPKIFRSKKKTLGVRIPDNNIVKEIVKELGNPILISSVHDDDEVVEYTTDPSLIYEKYQKHVEIVIDGGYGNNLASTVVDCTDNEINIIRKGVKELK